jgi:transposase
MTNRKFKSGVDRRQSSILPPRVEDYVDLRNPVRGIDAFAEGLDYVALGFRHVDCGGGAGQPPYHPKDLMKLYLYGYIHKIRSSRLLEREAQVNIEVMWLMHGLQPGYRTIANFRKDNRKALKKLNKEFVLVMQDLNLVGGTLVAIDGAFFDGNASKASITPHQRLAERVAAIQEDIEAYIASLDENDAAEAARSAAAGNDGDWRSRPGGEDVAQKVAALMEKRAKAQAGLEQPEKSSETQLSRTDPDAQLPSEQGHQEDVAQKVAALVEKRAEAPAGLEQPEKSGETQLSQTDPDARLPSKQGREDAAQKVAALVEKRARAQAELERLERSSETQLSRTDPDARLLSKRGQVVAGYNVQIAVDDKHKLIVASAVVNDGNDTGQLYKMAKAAKEELGVETLTALADSGYYNSNALKACEDDGITAYVPLVNRTGRMKAKGRITHEEFVYDADANAYRCPNDKLLKPTESPKINGDRVEIRYVSRKADCADCPLRSRCVTEKTPTRTVYRWEHEDVLNRHRARMKDADAPMRRRAELAEHPFGTLKCRAGYQHFLVRGFEKVTGEWSLMALSYNFTRVFNILGFDNVMAYFDQRAGEVRPVAA